MTQADRKTLARLALVLIALLVVSPKSIVAQSQENTKQRAEIDRLKERLQQLDQTVEELKEQITAIEEHINSAPSIVKADYPAAAENTAANPQQSGAQKGGSAFEMSGFATLASGYRFKQNQGEWFDVIRQTRLPALQQHVSSGDAAPSETIAAIIAPPETVEAAGSLKKEEQAPQTAPVTPAESQDDEQKSYGPYTPNYGFKLANTPYGDFSVSIFTYARYLNQRALDPTYTDALGNIKNVQLRQDFQLQKLQIKFLGWILSPKFRYFLYAWTSNASQGQGAQVVLAGNVNYNFNKYLTLSGGITSLPGTRSVEGNFPFWLGVDSRLIADEFFRPSYTSGIWARGNITGALRYQIMLGNNMSTLGVPASRLDNGVNTVSSVLVWTPTTEEFGAGFGDFERHDKLATRLAVHFSRSDENKESQPGTDTVENTQLRLSDGTVIFTPDLFGPGITVTDARYRMTGFDGGLKYRGYALEGEYFLRQLGNFRGVGTEGIEELFDHGYQIQASGMVKPSTLQLYVGHSKIFGERGNPWDVRIGANWFPWKNRVVRWNNEVLYLYKSPVGYTSVPFAVGGKGFIYHSSVELAF